MAKDSALLNNLQEIERQTLSSLDAAHDYFIHSKRVWLLLQQEVRKGRKFTIRNQTTGNQIHEQDLLAKGQAYLTDYLLPSTLQHLVSLFEHYVFELLRVWLVNNPKSLSGKQVKFEAVLTTGRAGIIQAVVEKELNDVKFGGIVDWFRYLKSLVSLNRPGEQDINNLAEIKASRDILVHNNGIVNETYVRKAGTCARYKDGEKLLISEQYLREVWEIIRRVVQDLSTATQKKASTMC